MGRFILEIAGLLTGAGLGWIGITENETGVGMAGAALVVICCVALWYHD